MYLQDMNGHYSQQFRAFSCGQQHFFMNSYFVARFSSYIYISLLLLSLCTLNIKFSEISFLIMHPNNLNAVFFIFYQQPFVVPILLRISLLVVYSIHGRPTIPFPSIHFFRVEIITHFSIHLLIYKFIFRFVCTLLSFWSMSSDIHIRLTVSHSPLSIITLLR